MKKILLLVFGLIMSLNNMVHATSITYEPMDLGGGRWEYRYNVLNDTMGSPIEEFSIYFDYGLYDNLRIDIPKAGWDGLTVNPDPILVPQKGYYDSLTLLSGIYPGSSENGFQVSFDWLGGGVPGPQLFEVIDPPDFRVLDSGSTTSVPEPGMLALLSMGVLGIISLQGQKKSPPKI